MMNNKFNLRFASLIIISSILFINTSISHSGEYNSSSDNAPMNFKKRKMISERYYKNYKKLRKAIPTLSPSQQEWLDKEANATKDLKSFERFKNLMESSEYDLEIVNSHLDLLIYALTKIKNTSATSKKEILHWAVVSNILASRQFVQSLHSLVDKKLLKSELLKFMNNSPDNFTLNFINSVNKSQLILRGIIIPYLDQRLPKH